MSLLGLSMPGAAVAEDSGLAISGCHVEDLATRHGAPALVIDEGAPWARARRCADGPVTRRPNPRVCFAPEVFPCTAVHGVLSEEGRCKPRQMISNGPAHT